MRQFSAVLLVSVLVSLIAASVSAADGAPNAKGLDAAISTGDLSGYLRNITTWLNQKTPAKAGDVTEATMKQLLNDPVFANALDQRQLISKHGADKIASFAQVGQSSKTFLSWLLRNTEAMHLYLESVVPTGLAAREQNKYMLPISALEIWMKILNADPDSKEGMYLKLAIATAVAPPGSGNHGAGQKEPPEEPLDRYQHFKSAHKNRELFPSFDKLTVWEYQQVVSSCASNSDLAWARQMINTWRPDLRVNEQVVNSTSEVWRRDSPHPYTGGYKFVLSGGGKCGPRSSWSVMICQAFGIPAIGVGQPAHACVAYKAIDASLQPQPGNIWKVAYGRGWEVSKLQGLSGPDFLAGVEERSRVTEFSQIEHLRWLASALRAPEQASAVMAIAHKIQKSAPAAPKKNLSASEKAAEADQELPSQAPAVNAAKNAAPKPGTSIKVPPEGARIEAAAFSKQSGLFVHDCFTGGKQVYFQKNMTTSWIEYAIDVAAAGTYALEMQTATPNDGQVMDLSLGAQKLATVKVPNTNGLWGAPEPTIITLNKGIQTLRLTAPYQRGIAIRRLELKAK